MTGFRDRLKEALMTMPRDTSHGRVQIGFWGPYQVGKTTYLTCLQEYLASVSEHGEATGLMIGPADRETAKYVEPLAAQLFDRGKVLEPTMKTTPPELYFEMWGTGRLGLREESLVIHIKDFAGEYYENPRDYPGLVEEYLQRCAAIIVLIDPTNKERHVSGRDSSSDSKTYRAMLTETLNLLHERQGMGKERYINQFMAFCVTKIDQKPWYDLRDKPWEVLKTIVGKLGYLKIAQFCHHQRCEAFAVSSYGVITDSNGQVIPNYDGIGLIDMEHWAPINLFKPLKFLWDNRRQFLV